MHSHIENLNQLGGTFLSFAWPMLWQSSLLITALLVFDLFLKRKLRASVRHALWLVVLVKLCVPTTLALPTSPAWWLHKTPPPVVAKTVTQFTVTYESTPLPDPPHTKPAAFTPSKAVMNLTTWLLVVSAAVSLAMLGWLMARWWQITRLVRRAERSERLAGLAGEAQKSLGVKLNVPVKLTAQAMSPAVCGLFRPAILIPEALAENFTDEQMRTVLLHEFSHLRRRDVWVNFLQSLLQIGYWWHPLVWVANARIRRVREEAVDDAVMLALRDEADEYAPTLLEVAKLALNRPRVSLGLVGIMESRTALRSRIERLVDFQAPRQAGMTLVSLLGTLAFTAVAVLMGEGPGPAELPAAIAPAAMAEQSLTVKVDREAFSKNIQGQAAKFLLSPTNDYTEILLEDLRSEGLDCNPPHGLAINTKTGEITMQNTPDKLEIFRQVMEQLNRTDGVCKLPLRNSSLRKKLVLIQASIYEMGAADFDKVIPGLGFYPGNHGDGSWWSVAPDQYHQLTGSMESSGLQPVQRPRIQTGSGVPAQFFVGDKKSGVEFDCLPDVKDGFVDLTLQSTVVTGRPAEGAFTNQFKTKASAQNHGGIVVRMENFDGHAGSNLVVVIGIHIVADGPGATIRERLQTLRTRPGDTNKEAAELFTRTFKVDTRTFIKSLIGMGADIGGKTNSPAAVSTAMRQFLASLGVNMQSPGKGVFFNERDGRLLVQATRSDLDVVEQAVQTLSYHEPQIHLKARFYQIPEGTLARMKNLLETNGTSAGGFTGSLTRSNSQTVLKQLQMRKGFENLGELEGMTANGRQVNFSSGSQLPIIGLIPAIVKAELPSVNFPPGYQTNGVIVIRNKTYPSEPLDTGVNFDASVSAPADGETIVVHAKPSFTEFFGYAPTKETALYPAGMPSIRVRKTETLARLYEGQTLWLAGFKATTCGEKNIPKKANKELIVLVTAEIVDPAGGNLHADRDMPFARAGTPAQPPHE